VRKPREIKTCDKNGGFWRRFFRMEISLIIFFTLGSNKNDQTPRHNQLRVPLSHTHALPHICDMHTADSLRIHFLCNVMPSVISGGYHCMCGNALTIPQSPSLSFFIPSPTVYLAAQIGCSRCAHHLITLKYKQIIVFLQLTLGLRVRVVPEFQSCVWHQACAPGFQTGA